MKIYNEIVIDMNPESSSYGKTLHEDSCNYTGDIILCRTAGGGGTVGAPASLKGLTAWLDEIKSTTVIDEEGNEVPADEGAAPIGLLPDMASDAKIW